MASRRKRLVDEARAKIEEAVDLLRRADTSPTWSRKIVHTLEILCAVHSDLRRFAK